MCNKAEINRQREKSAVQPLRFPFLFNFIIHCNQKSYEQETHSPEKIPDLLFYSGHDLLRKLLMLCQQEINIILQCLFLHLLQEFSIQLRRVLFFRRQFVVSLDFRQILRGG